MNLITRCLASVSGSCFKKKKSVVMMLRDCCHILKEVEVNKATNDDRQCQITFKCAEIERKAPGIFVMVCYHFYLFLSISSINKYIILPEVPLLKLLSY